MTRLRITRISAAVIFALGLVVLGLGVLSPAEGQQHPHQAAASAAAPRHADGRLVLSDFGTGQLYTVNPNGSALRQITHLANGFLTDAVWSPDSRHIAASGLVRGDSFRLFVMKSNGHGRHMVGSERKNYQDFTPGYTPSGRKLVYARCKPDPPGGCALFSIRLNGSHRHHLTPFTSGDHEVADFEPRVSPDGHWISFTRFDFRGIHSQVWVMRVNGSQARPITPSRLEAHTARWTPDGKHLVFQNNSFRWGTDLFRVRLDGRHRHRLTRTPFPQNTLLSAPSPSGRRIAFVSDIEHPDLCCQDLYAMRANGSHQHQVKTGLTFVGPPDWGSAPLKKARASVRLHPSSTGLTRRDAQVLSTRPWTWRR